MKLKLENIESKRTQELANLIRAYNRSNREPSKSEPLNIYLEDEQGNLVAGLNIYMSVMIYGDKVSVQKF